MIDYPIPETSEGVRDLVREFCKTWEKFLPEYSFAHVIFEHLSLGNDTIDFCVYEELASWYALKMSEFADENIHSPYYWERSRITEWMQFTDEAVWFLLHLKNIPEAIREGVSDLDD